VEQKIASLIDYLANEEAEIHRAKLSELSDLDSEHVNLFLDAWPRISVSRRRMLIDELGQLADDQIELRFEAINLAVLDDEDASVRLQAVRNLWEFDGSSFASSLKQMLELDDSDEVRVAAARALGRFIYLHELDKLKGASGPELEKALIQSAEKDSSQEVRLESLTALGFSSNPEVPELILSAYQAGEEAQLLASLKAIGHSANDRWRELVIEQLHNPIPEIRAEAVRAAGELELSDTLDDVVDHLDDVSDPVREAAIWALGQLGGNEALEALGQLMEEAEDMKERILLTDAIDNLVFVDGTKQFPLINFDPTEDSST
jgi:HEAT repeat protein